MAAKPREVRAEVREVRWLADDLAEADFRVTAPAGWTFRAGDSVAVAVGDGESQLPIASTPSRIGAVTIAADVSRAGAAGEWLRGLTPGAAVGFKGPVGSLGFDRADPRRALFVAEEIGVVSARSVLAHLYETGHGRPTALIAWGRDPSRLVYEAQFRSLARRYPSFSYLPAVREASGVWRGETGEPADAVERLVHSVDRLLVYVLGGAETVQRVRDVLAKKGIDRRSVKAEKLW